jgi:hypothetical protein
VVGGDEDVQWNVVDRAFEEGGGEDGVECLRQADFRSLEGELFGSTCPASSRSAVRMALRRFDV